MEKRISCDEVLNLAVKYADFGKIYDAVVKIHDEILEGMRMKPLETLLISIELIESAILTAIINCMKQRKGEEMARCLNIADYLFCLTIATYKTIHELVEAAVAKAGGYNEDVVPILIDMIEDSKKWFEVMIGKD